MTAALICMVTSLRSTTSENRDLREQLTEAHDTILSFRAVQDNPYSLARLAHTYASRNRGSNRPPTDQHSRAVEPEPQNSRPNVPNASRASRASKTGLSLTIKEGQLVPGSKSETS